MMFSHKKIISKFNRLENKYFSDSSFQISKNHLHLLIWNTKYNSSNFKISGFLSNSILLILSIITIFVCKIKKIKIANYFIVHKNKNGSYDFRSDYILKNYNFKNSLNIIRCSTFIDSLKAYFKYPNVIFYLSIDYFNSSFSFKKGSIKEHYIVLHQKEKKNYKFIKKIFIFLNIKKFLSIDDQRVIQVFLKVCYDLKIKSFGYMHYKFTNYVVGIKYLCFDYFIVWSEYFKKKLIEVNKEYKSKKIFISGYFKKELPKSTNNKSINILYIIDMDLDFKSTIQLLKKLNNQKNINLYVKLKPQKQESKWEIFCNNYKIKYFKQETLDQVNKAKKFDFFIANISTAILEASLYCAMPLKLQSKNDFADDLFRDKVVKKIKNVNDIIRVTKRKPSKKEINKIFYMVWGKIKYNPNNIKKIFFKYIYDRKN